MAKRVSQEAGYINLLVANAGMAGPGLRGIGPRATATDFVRSAWTTPMPEFDKVYNLNCTATYYTILAFLELLDAGNKRRQPGDSPSQVVATSSMVAFQRDPRYGFAYLSSKAALVSMIKSFATFGVSWGIRFNTIAPGCK
jgi:NAD(P)-dependent dehydrogenase (short-subunit alcohol dehydrogenase family)